MQDNIRSIADRVDFNPVPPEPGIEIAPLLPEVEQLVLELIVIAVVENVPFPERGAGQQFLEAGVLQSGPGDLDGRLADQYRFTGVHADFQRPHRVSAFDRSADFGVVITEGLETVFHPLAGGHQEVQPGLYRVGRVSQPRQRVAAQVTLQAGDTVFQNRLARLRGHTARQQQPQGEQAVNASIPHGKQAQRLGIIRPAAPSPRNCSRQNAACRAGSSVPASRPGTPPRPARRGYPG